MTYDIVRLLHIGFASFWLASIVKELFSPFELKGRLDEMRHYLVGRRKVGSVLGAIGGIGTLLSGVGLLRLIGATDNPWALNLGMSLALVVALIGLYVISGGYAKAIQAIDAGAQKTTIENHIASTRKWTALAFGLWLLTFTLMGLRNLI